MPIKQTYTAVFINPDFSLNILRDYKNEELKTELERLLLDKYNIEYKFLKYSIYDLRHRRHRVSKYIRNIIPSCDIHTPELNDLLTANLELVN